MSPARHPLHRLLGLAVGCLLCLPAFSEEFVIGNQSKGTYRVWLGYWNRPFACRGADPNKEVRITQNGSTVVELRPGHNLALTFFGQNDGQRAQGAQVDGIQFALEDQDGREVQGARFEFDHRASAARGSCTGADHAALARPAGATVPYRLAITRDRLDTKAETQ